MRGIMLHCGSDSISRSELAELPVAKPMGTRHVIRPFIDDITDVSEILVRMGYGIKDEAYGVLTGDDDIPKRYFGLMSILSPSDDHRDDFEVTIGLRGAYDQSFARGLVVGSNVFVCDNLCFSGDIMVKTKQTTHIGDRISELLSQSLARLPQMVYMQSRQFDRYKSIQITGKTATSFLADMVRTKILNGNQYVKALSEWDNPSHEEHTETGHSVWRLHNALTEAIKPSNPDRNNVAYNWDRSLRITEACDRLTGQVGR